TNRHKLAGLTERYVILEGRGSAQVDGAVRDVEAGDVVTIPPGAPQCITNTGRENLVFFAICTPRFTPESYLPLAGRDKPTCAESRQRRLRDVPPYNEST